MEGGDVQLATGVPFEPARTPSEAIMLALANIIVKIPDNGPKRKNVVLHGRGVHGLDGEG